MQTPLQRFNLFVPMVSLALVLPWNYLGATDWISHLLGPLGLMMVLGYAALLLGIGVVYRSLRDDPFLARAGFACFVLPLFALAMGTLTFLGAGLQFPFVDAQLASFDRALGLDWPAYLAWSANEPLMQAYALKLYGLWFALAPILLIVHCFIVRDAARLEHLIAFLVLSGVLTVSISIFAPASSVFAFHNVPAELGQRLHSAVDAGYADVVAAMRAGRIVSINDVAHGTVTFPSHHTVIGVTGVLYSLRYRLLRLLMVLPSVAMIAVTPVIGGHYFADIFGGLLVALVSYVAVNRMARGANTVGEGAPDLLSQPA